MHIKKWYNLLWSADIIYHPVESVFAVIKCTTTAMQQCGKTSACNYCNSESQGDTPCKLIPENPDAHAERLLPGSLPPAAQLTFTLVKWQNKTASLPPSPAHTHPQQLQPGLTLPRKCCPARAVTPLARHHNSQWQQTTVPATNYPGSLTEKRRGREIGREPIVMYITPVCVIFISKAILIFPFTCWRPAVTGKTNN